MVILKALNTPKEVNYATSPVSARLPALAAQALWRQGMQRLRQERSDLFPLRPAAHKAGSDRYLTNSSPLMLAIVSTT